MEVKRYECGNGEGVFRDNNGFLVFYEDYAKLKAENEELNEWTKSVVDRFNNLNGQHTQLKEKLKEVEDCYKLGWEDGAKAAANDIASRI